MSLSLIVAMTRGGLIGHRGKLPWRLSADLKRFKSLTMGHHLIMGRKTFDSLPRLLPGRTSIIITRQPTYLPPAGALLAHSLDRALQLAAQDNEPFVIGGGEIFAVALPRASRIYVTWVEANVEGDTLFPQVELSQWTEVSRERHSADQKNEYDYTFCTYDRVTTPVE